MMSENIIDTSKLSEEEYEQYLLWLDEQNTKAMAEVGITPWFFPPEDGLHDF